MHALIRDKALAAIIDGISYLKDIRNFRVLDGGLTNKNYRIDTADGSYVMRVSSEKTSLLGINRQNERVNTRRAFQAGVGAELMDAPAADNIMVLRWIDAKTLDATHFQAQPALIPRVARALKTLHSGPAFQGSFHFPAVRASYLKTVLGAGYFLPDQYLQLEPLVLALEDKLAQHPENPVPCNNDLLAENFLDDGKKIWIIDYEYAGQNEASFDIGNLAGESALNDEQLTALCDAYWGKHNLSGIARARAWSVIARFGWVLWASIQEVVSPIAFDFRSWGLRKLQSVLPELEETRYQQIIENLNV